MKITKKRMLRLGLGTLLAIGMAEALLWLTPRSLLPGEFRLLDRVYTARSAWQMMMVGDPYLGYKLKPGTDMMFPSEGREIRYRTADFGLGDIGFRQIGTDPPFEGLVVGDSFALCDDVPEEACWIRHVSERTGISFVTLGVNGFSNMAAARVLKRYGPAIRPKVVLASFYPNDYKDNVNFDAWTRSGTDNLWVWLGNRRGRGEWTRSLADYSMIYRVIDGFNRTGGRKIYPYEDERLDYVFRLDHWWLRLLHDAEKHEGFALAKKALLDMQATSREFGAEFMVLLFPVKEQIYWEQARQFAEEQDLDVDRPLDVVYRFCRENGIACCLMNDEMRAAAHAGSQLYHRINSHWNDRGNAVGANLVAKCLDEAGFIERVRSAADRRAP